MKIRKLLIVFFLIIVIEGIFAPLLRASAEVSTGLTFGRGTWGGNLQGVRFSIYDTVACQTLCVLDMFKGEENTNLPYGAFCARIVNNPNKRGIKLCYGSKLDYLYQYQVENNSNIDIKDLNLKYINYYSSLYSPPANWSYSLIPSSNRFSDYLQPVWSNTDGVVFVDCDSFKFIMQNHKPLVEQYILNPMGYTFYEQNIDAGYNYLETSYILSAEPIYYFLNGIDSGNGGINWFYFYGTATEFAIWDKQLISKNQLLWNNGYTPYGHNTLRALMGTLTHRVAPLAISPQETKVILLNGEELNDDGSIPPEADHIIIESPNNELISNKLSSAKIDEMIVLQYGVELMKRADFDELTVDIVSENTVFRTGTKGIVSFNIVSSGITDFIPDINDMINNSGSYYGLKLVLNTLNSSTGGGKDMPARTEILCDGLPSNFVGESNVPMQVDTVAFTTFDVPREEGVWRFSLDVYSTLGQEDYTSNTGELNSVLKKYCFNVKFEDASLVYPLDTAASDKMPAGFAAPSFDINSVSLNQPVTSLSWHRYEATIGADEQGNSMVYMRTVYETASASIGDNYAPTTYGNVPEKFKNGILQTRSGYGIGLDVLIDSGGITGFQSGTALFPEFGYRDYGVRMEKYGNYLRMSENPNSMYYNDPAHADFSRVHFTPIWYPNGEYEIAVFIYDNWTPVGQLWDCKTYTVSINGTIYDDWYITRR